MIQYKKYEKKISLEILFTIMCNLNLVKFSELPLYLQDLENKNKNKNKNLMPQKLDKSRILKFCKRSGLIKKKRERQS